MDLEGSHCAIEQRRGLAKLRRRLWFLPNVDFKNNLHSHRRRPRPGVPAQWDVGRSHPDSDRVTDSYTKRHRVADSYSKWYDKPHSYSKCDCKSYGNPNSDSYDYG